MRIIIHTGLIAFFVFLLKFSAVAVVTESRLNALEELVFFNPTKALSEISSISSDLENLSAFNQIRILRTEAYLENGQFIDAMSVLESECDGLELSEVDTMSCYVMTGRVLHKGLNLFRAELYYSTIYPLVMKKGSTVMKDRLNYYLADVYRDQKKYAAASKLLSDFTESIDEKEMFYAEAVFLKLLIMTESGGASAGTVLKRIQELDDSMWQSTVKKAQYNSFLSIILQKNHLMAEAVQVGKRALMFAESTENEVLMTKVLVTHGRGLRKAGFYVDAGVVIAKAVQLSEKLKINRLIQDSLTEEIELLRLLGKHKDAYRQMKRLHDIFSTPQVDVGKVLGRIAVSEPEVESQKENELAKTYYHSMTWGFIGVIFVLFIMLVRRKLPESNGNSAREVEVQQQLDHKLKRLMSENHHFKEELDDIRQRFIQQSKMSTMGEMMAVVVHQWKQPITTMQLIVQGMRIDMESDEVDIEHYREENNKLMMQMTHMVETLDRFGQFFKPQDGNDRFMPQKELATCVEILEVQLQKSNIQFIQNIDPDHKLWIEGNANEFKQVIINLIINAKEALAERDLDRQLTLELNHRYDTVEIRISDNGCGMSEGVLSQIFDSWYTTKKEKGSGIGLYLSKMIVEERLYGKLSVWSDGPGKGAEFILEIPGIATERAI